MKKVIVLGAGHVSRPCVQYLLSQPGYEVYVADICEENINRVLSGKNNGHAVPVTDAIAVLPKMLKEIQPDALICLLPRQFMTPAAKCCIEAGVNYINPSYVSPEMKGLDGAAKEKGIALLCELGMDPGIDHMCAAKAVREIHEKKGKIVEFELVCGAVPAAKDNNNPVGYKLSWAPSSLIGASVRDAHIIVDGKTIDWLGGETYRHCKLTEIDGLGWFEQYANADSTPYVEEYNIPEVRTIYRGTLRYIGWSDMICRMQDLGLYKPGEHDFTGKTYADVMRGLVSAGKSEDIKAAAAKFLKESQTSAVMMKLEWLGLFDERPVPINKGTMSQLVECIYNEKLQFAPHEDDLSIMELRFTVEYPDRKALVKHTLIDYGSSDTDFSVGRLTGLPPAMGAQLIIEGRIAEKGIISPSMPEVYIPELDALEKMDIRFKVTETKL